MHMIYIYTYDVHWTFVRSFWMLPEIGLAAHLLSVCVQPPAILPNNINMFEAKNDINLICTESWNDVRIWNFKGCNFGSRRQEAAASVKRQKVDAYESGSTEFHEER